MRLVDKGLLQETSGADKYLSLSVLVKSLGSICYVLFAFIAAYLWHSLAIAQHLPLSIILGCVATIAVLMVVRQELIKLDAAFSSKLVSIIKSDLRQALFKKTLALGTAFEKHISRSRLMQMSVEGVEQLETYYGGYIAQFRYCIVVLLILFAALLPFAPVPALLLLLSSPLIPLMLTMILKKARATQKTYWNSYANVGKLFLDSLEGLTTLKVFSADQRRSDELDDRAEDFRLKTMRLLRMQLSSMMPIDFIAYGCTAAAIIVGLNQCLAGNISIFAMILILTLAAEFFVPTRRLTSLFHVAMTGVSVSEEMFNYLKAPEPAKGTVATSFSDQEITITNLHFTYDETQRARVLHGMNLSIAFKGITAIVGPSGCGKSTLASILIKKQRVQDGMVFFGEADINEISDEALYSAIHLVDHEAFVFEGTIRSNLLLGKSSASDQEMLAALKTVSLLGYAEANQGLDTTIQPRGANLSGGQAQRLTIARALLADSPYYIFDEATSNVDLESEKIIFDAIEKLAQTKSVILITHRLASAKNAKKIAVIQNGSIVQLGNHDSLLDQQGLYQQLYTEQQELDAITNLAAMQETSYTADTDCESQTDSQINTQFDNQSEHKSTTPSRRSGFKIMQGLVGLIKPLAPFMVLAVISGVLGFIMSAALGSLGAYALSSLLSFAESSKLPLALSLKAVSIALLSAAFLRAIFYCIEQYFNHLIAFKILANIRHHVFTAMRRLAPAKLEGRQKGELIGMVTSDIEMLEVFYAHTVSPICIASICSIIFIAVLTQFHAVFSLIAAVFLLVIGFAVPLVAAGLGKNTSMKAHQSLGKINGEYLETLSGIRELIQYKQGSTVLNKLNSRTSEIHQSQHELKTTIGTISGWIDTLLLAGNTVCILAATVLAYTGVLDVGVSIAGAFIAVSALVCAVPLANLGTTLLHTFAAGERVLRLLEETPQTEEIIEGQTITANNNTDIDIADVWFAYPGSTGGKVLQGASLNIPRGKIIGIQGKSGCGKSTLIKLIMRFWDVEGGSISLCNDKRAYDVRRLNTQNLREQMCYMTQSTTLFTGTIRENLLIAKSDATDEQIELACQKASLWLWIKSLPQGLDTWMAELGSNCSGGEKQRLGLARCFLSERPIMHLDEPTSNLDSLNEAIILRSLKEETQGKTILLVSHRPTTLTVAHKIFIMKEGKCHEK